MWNVFVCACALLYTSLASLPLPFLTLNFTTYDSVSRTDKCPLCTAAHTGLVNQSWTLKALKVEEGI